MNRNPIQTQQPNRWSHPRRTYEMSIYSATADHGQTLTDMIDIGSLGSRHMFRLGLCIANKWVLSHRLCMVVN